MSKRTPTKQPPKLRSGVAIAAQHRNSAGPMHHRLQPRGGTKAALTDDDLWYIDDDGNWANGKREW